MDVSKLLKDSLEDNTLTLLCWDMTVAPIIAMQVSAELFSTREYQRLAQFAIDHISRYGLPPRGHLRDYLEQELRRREGSFLKQIIDAMEKLHPELQGKFVQHDLDLFVAKRQFAMSMDAAYQKLDQDDLAGARDALYAASAVVKPQTGVWLHDTERWFSFLNRQGTSELSSGIDIFDERGIRPNKRELYLHIGPKKSGKTWAMIQIGRRAVQSRHDVLHVTLENSSEITQQRYMQAFLQMTADQTRLLRMPLFKYTATGRFYLDWDPVEPGKVVQSASGANRTAGEVLLDKERDALANLIKPFQWTGRVGSPGRLYVQECATGTLTIAQLNHMLDYLERAERFKPDMVVLDYINLMQIGDVRQHRLSLGRLGVELRGIAVARDLAMVTTTQGNRSSATAKLVTGTHVAEDWSLLGTADTVVTYSQTPKEREINVARMFVDAARNAPDKWIAQISQSYATGQFCSDSVYMDKAVADEMARHLADDDQERQHASADADADADDA